MSLTQLSNDIYGLPIPKKVKPRLNRGRVEYGNSIGGIFYYRLPTGSWEIIGTSDEMTEDDVTDIDLETKFDDYDDMYWKIYNSDQDEWVLSPLESFQSLLASKNLKGRVLIIKKT